MNNSIEIRIEKYKNEYIGTLFAPEKEKNYQILHIVGKKDLFEAFKEIMQCVKISGRNITKLIFDFSETNVIELEDGDFV